MLSLAHNELFGPVVSREPVFEMEELVS
jgi:hypothetical protein